MQSLHPFHLRARRVLFSYPRVDHHPAPPPAPAAGDPVTRLNPPLQPPHPVIARRIVPLHPTLRSHPHHQHSAMTALCNHCIMQSPPFLLRARRPYPAGRPLPAPPPPGSREDPPTPRPPPLPATLTFSYPGVNQKAPAVARLNVPPPAAPAAPPAYTLHHRILPPLRPLLFAPRR